MFCRQDKMPLWHVQGIEQYMWNGRLLFHVRGEELWWEHHLQLQVSAESLRSRPLIRLALAPQSSQCEYVWYDRSIERCRCLHKSQIFPPGRSIWCNDGLHGGPTARPVGRNGAHACCKDRDFCNRFLWPKTKDQRSDRVEEGRQISVQGACAYARVSLPKTPPLWLLPFLCSLARRSTTSCPVLIVLWTVSPTYARWVEVLKWS